MDDELRALMVAELERHLGDLEDAASPMVPETTARERARRVAHGLKGSFGMAGSREASALFARLERRIGAGDIEARRELAASIRGLRADLAKGTELRLTRWPEPPSDLVPQEIDPTTAAEYRAASRDRISKIDATLVASTGVADPASVLDIYREVHTLKGSALAVGDEVMAWFCHGLEDRLRGVSSTEQAEVALSSVETMRGVLSEIVDAPDHALATLRLMSGAPVRPSMPPPSVPLPLPPKRPSIKPTLESDARGLSEEGTVRVSSAILDALFERAGQVSQLRGPLASGSSRIARSATSVREVARDVRDALRMIGPPRPWGAPAAAIVTLERCARALDPLASALDGFSGSVASVGGRLVREGYALSSSVASLRTTTASSLFERVATAAQSEARRMDRAVEVLVTGGETPVDRRLVEALLEPLRQLARNAIVHGLEPSDERVRLGKDPRGRLRLAAAQRAGSLVITVSDDGAGVDTARVRQNATSAGLVSHGLADGMTDGALLSLLFYPGFSMRGEADLLAGRGVGLDLALAAVHRIGGTIHLTSKRGRGLMATVVVPTEGAMVRVVWLESRGATFALAVQHTGQIRMLDDAPDAVPLSSLVSGGDGPPTERFTIDVAAPFEEGPPLSLGVDAVGSVDEVALRALPSVARALGPWSAAVVWADDLRLALDPTRLVQLARSRAG